MMDNITINNGKFFQNSDIAVTGHELGYINDISQGDNPVNSVYDCSNFDFRKGFSEMRDSYSIFQDLTTVLPSGFTVDNFFVKEFVDKVNVVTECIVVIAKKSGEKTKVFINKYYNGGNTCGNGKNSTTGWITEWTELTENTDFVVTGGIAAAYGTTTITASKTVAVDYYRGFFVYNNTNQCVGFVTKSTAASSGASITLTIRMNCYLSGGTAIALYTITTLDTYTLSRFPVNVKEDLTDITGYDIIESTNTLRFATGKYNRILWLGLINDRNYFKQTSPIGSGDHAYYTRWYGWWFGYDVPFIPNKKIYQNDYSVTGGSSTKFIQAETETGTIIYYELLNSGSTDQSTVKAASLCISLDGYQPIFLKNLLIDINSGTHPSKIAIWDDIGMIWTLEFDRRFTDLHLFYDKNDYFKTVVALTEDDANEIFPTYQMEVYSGGSINFTDKPRNSGLYDVTKNAYITYFVQSAHAAMGYDWAGVGYNYANGVSLNAYLNSYYYNDVHINCKKLIKIDNQVLAIGIFNKESQIALTNIINGDVEAESLYSPERLTNITYGDPLIAGARTQRTEFLLFTTNECIVCEVIDKKSNIIAVKDRLVNQGIVSAKSVVTAKFRGELQGVFWAGNKGIYSFIDNQVIELTQGRWNNEYLAFSDNVKAAIVGGYLPNKNDVFFVINSKIYIYNLLFQHWKKYDYSDIPTILQTNQNGEINFIANSNYIFNTEKMGSSVYLDKGSVRYSASITQLFNHNAVNTHKVLNQIEANYDISLNHTSADLQVTAGCNNTTGTDIINKTALIDDSVTKPILKITTINKLRSNFYNVKFVISSSTGELRLFKLYSLLLRAKLTGKKLLKV